MKFLLLVLTAFACLPTTFANADDSVPLQAPAVPSSDSSSWWGRWMNHVSEIQAAQPHWVTPLVTVTPRLEQELRFDYVDQETTKAGPRLQNIDNGKGLEIIPLDDVEVILNAPPYLEHNSSTVADGFGDFSALVKYRILSANREHGDYILTAFLGVSSPTGAYKNGSPATVVTPSVSAGKGFGSFDVQSILGVALPDIPTLSHSVLWNTALQYHFCDYFWPELEANYTLYTGGENVGLDQLFLTPGVMFGRFPIHNRVGFTIGAGEQIAVSSFHSYDHAWVISARLPF